MTKRPTKKAAPISRRWQLGAAAAKFAGKRAAPPNPFTIPPIPPGVLPRHVKAPGAGAKIAQDAAAGQFDATSWAGTQWASLAQSGFAFGYAEGITFQGYPYLAYLSNIAEYRVISETIATEMTRKWIKFQSKSAVAKAKAKKEAAKFGEVDEGDDGDEDQPTDPQVGTDRAPDADLSKMFGLGGEQDGEQGDEPTDAEVDEETGDEAAEKIKQLTEEFERLKVQDVFATIALYDGFFGRAHIYIDLGTDLDSKEGLAELVTPLGDGKDAVTRAKILPGKDGDSPIKRLAAIEPMWAYPAHYNASNPLKADWYRPTTWYAQQQEIHHSRFLTFVGRPVPDVLKPSYAFGGLSLTQMAKPYVDNWLVTRQAVTNLIRSFTTWVLKTNMATVDQDGGQVLLQRANLFTTTKDNSGLMITDKETEEFENIQTSLGSLDALQAQSQEHMAAVSRIPLVKLTGIAPKGLNASSEGEIRVFYDSVHAYQQRFFKPHLTTLFWMTQVGLWGEVDEDLEFAFNPLWELDELQRADVRKKDAETGKILIDGGVIAPEEDRERVANDPESLYPDIDPADVPEPPVQEGILPGGEGGGKGGMSGGGESPFGGGSPSGAERGEAGDGAIIPFGVDQARLSKTESNYTLNGVGTTRCGACDMYRDPARCSLVAGYISPADGLCDYFERDPWYERPVFDAEFKEADHPRRTDGKFGSGGGAAAPLKMGDLRQVGGQKGSNPGGVYEDKQGKKFYVKAARSGDHARSEVLAGKLYELAGAPTIKYRPVEGGKHVATEWEAATKTSAREFTPGEVKKAQDDFAVHAWLANWDAAGLDYDNQMLIGGKPTSVDLGGALEWRAQGEPKGGAFGDKAGEWDTLRDPKVNSQNAKLFAGMTQADLKRSAEKVTRVPDDKIRQAVEAGGKPAALADKLIARKADIAKRAGVALDELLRSVIGDEFTESKHPRVKGGAQAGQFTAGGGGSSAPSVGAKLAKFLAGATHPKGQHVAGIQKVLNGKAQQNTDYHGVVGQLIKHAEKDPETKPAIPGLLKKLSEGLALKAKALEAEGKHVEAMGFHVKAEKAWKLGGGGPLPFAAPAAPKPAEPPKQSAAAGYIEKAMAKYKENTAGKNMTGTLEIGKQKIKAVVQTGYTAELAKEWLTPEQKHEVDKVYGSVEAAFNKGKEYQAQQAAASNAQLQQQAVNEAKAKKTAEEFAKEFSDPESQEMLKTFAAIVGGGATSKEYLSRAKDKIKAAGLTGKISPVEAAQILAYSGSHYSALNKQLRKGAMTEEQWNYAQALQKALSKLPPYVGTTKRGTDLEDQARFQVGYIVEMHEFMSTSKAAPFSGDFKLTVHGKTGRDIQKLASNSHEAEVLFPYGTRFKVEERVGNKITLREV